MKKLLIFVLSLSCITLLASTGQSPKRMGNQIYVSFDKPRNIDLVEGIRYYPQCPDPDVKMDLYVPKPNPKQKTKEFRPVPCILIIHGGGWSMGNEKKWAMMASYFASKGYLTASISYRLRPEYKLEDCVEDCKRALYWLRKNAHTYGGDPSSIGVTGGSAGGHLSALLATSGGSSLFKEIFTDGTSDKIQACVPMAPVTDLSADKKFRKLYDENVSEETLKKLSPIHYVSKDTPPMRILHAKNEKVVSFSESENLKSAYDKVGVPCEIIAYDTTKHAFWNIAPIDTFRQKSWDDALEFFDKILKDKQK